jgi:hypothetical protein
MIDDDVLVKEFIDGNNKSFDILYKRYEKKIYAIIEKFGFEKKDTSQDIWLSVVKKIKLFG